jgi:hypothetical protein
VASRPRTIDRAASRRGIAGAAAPAARGGGGAAARAAAAAAMRVSYICIISVYRLSCIVS